MNADVVLKGELWGGPTPQGELGGGLWWEARLLLCEQWIGASPVGVEAGQRGEKQQSPQGAQPHLFLP